MRRTDVPPTSIGKRTEARFDRGAIELQFEWYCREVFMGRVRSRLRPLSGVAVGFLLLIPLTLLMKRPSGRGGPAAAH